MEEILNKFDSDFVKKFRHDATFNVIVYALLSGQSPYKIIEELIIKQSDLMEQYVKVLKNMPPAPTMVNIKRPLCDKCGGEIRRKHIEKCPIDGKFYCEKCIDPDEKIYNEKFFGKKASKNKLFDELRNEMEAYIKECGYTWTVDSIIYEYRQKYSKGFYVSYTCNEIIKKFEDRLALNFLNKKDGSGLNEDYG